MRDGLITALVLSILLSGSCRVDHVNPPSLQLHSISVMPSGPSAAPGTTRQLEAAGTYSDGTTRTITSPVGWLSSDPSVAAVTSSGLLIAEHPGSATITATYLTFTASTAFECSPVAALILSPAAATIAENTTIGFQAIATLQNGADQDLTRVATWDSSNTAVAAVAQDGTASSLSNTGSSTISAAFGGETGTAILTVAALTSLSVAPLTATIILGGQQQFTATGTLAGGVIQDLTTFATWASGSPDVAVIGSGANSPGLAASVGAGTSIITASFGGMPSNAAALTVNPAELQSISITPGSASVAVGQTLQFTATGHYTDGSEQDITASADWTSSNGSVASVGSITGTKGLATGLAEGTVSLSATFKGVASNAATLHVLPAILVSITVLPSAAVMTVGSSLQFTARGTFSDGTVEDLTAIVLWGASNVAVSVSNTPGTNGMVTAVSLGSPTLTATLGNVTGTAELTITF